MRKFPKDANLKRQWDKLVQVSRADFVEPSEHSVVYSSHFSLDCYEKKAIWSKWALKSRNIFFLALYQRFRHYQKQILPK